MTRKNPFSSISSKSLPAVIAFLALVCSVTLSFAYLSITNTFLNNPNWLPEKAVAVKESDSAAAQLILRSALFKERLNPHFYFGNASVSYKDKITPTELSFDLELSLGGWLAVTLSRDKEIKTGIRFSANDYYKNMFFTAGQAGQFTQKTPFTVPNLQWDKKTKIRISFDTDKIQVWRDGRLLAASKTGIDKKHKYVFAFTCGQNPVYIDNVEIKTQTKTIYEDFSRLHLLVPVSAIVFVILFLLVSAMVRVLKRQHQPKHRIMMITIKAQAVLLVIVLTLIIMDRMTGPIEPAAMFMPMKKAELEKIFTRYKDSGSRLGDIYKYNIPVRDKYSVRHIIKQVRAGLIRQNNTRKIIFLGDSQIRGWNRSDISLNIVDQTEQILNQKLDSKHIKTTCINAGLPGKTAEEIYHVHEKNWANLKADICIINIRNNDIDSFMENGHPSPKEFGRHLERIVRINKDNGTRSILIIEAIAKTFPGAGDDFEEFKTSIRKVAHEHKCPLWDLDSYITEQSDSGFLWEDSIHLSPYGTKLASRFIADRLSDFIKIRRLTPENGHA